MVSSSDGTQLAGADAVTLEADTAGAALFVPAVLDYRFEVYGRFVHVRDFTDVDGFMGGFADLDNLDLAFAGDDLVYLNDGRGRFSAGPSVPVGRIRDPRAIGFADIDADGDLDFAVGVKYSRWTSSASTRGAS